MKDECLVYASIRPLSFITHMNDKSNEIEQLGALVGALIVAFEPCKWGFENRTVIVTVEDGGRLVVSSTRCGAASMRAATRAART